MVFWLYMLLFFLVATVFSIGLCRKKQQNGISWRQNHGLFPFVLQHFLMVEQVDHPYSYIHRLGIAGHTKTHRRLGGFEWSGKAEETQWTAADGGTTETQGLCRKSLSEIVRNRKGLGHGISDEDWHLKIRRPFIDMYVYMISLYILMIILMYTLYMCIISCFRTSMGLGNNSWLTSFRNPGISVPGDSASTGHGQCGSAGTKFSEALAVYSSLSIYDRHR